MTTTVSAKIPEELKTELDRADVNVSAVIRTALEAEVTERRREALREDAEAFSERIGDEIDTDDIVQAVRDSRQDR